MTRVCHLLGGAMIALAALCLAGPASAGNTVKVKMADGFDFPVGKPNAAGYYKARGMRLRSPGLHYGEDWNGRGGGDSDLGDPIYSIGNGVVTWAYDVRKGWGRVVIIRHAYRDPATGKVKFCDSLYGHLRSFSVKVGQQVKRGDKIGTMGSNRGMYPAGMQRSSVARSLTNWADPTTFINKYRRLNREWRKQPVPIGTYKEYAGFKGL